MKENEFSSSSGMTPRRVESLADGIFAFAMTLLVLSINQPGTGPGVNVGAYLLGQYQNFWNFALSFLLLATFWISHSQQYHHIKKTDAVTLWLNILMLLFVVLIPFSASLMNDHTSDLAAEVFFNSNLLVLSSLLAFNWGYAFKKGLIEPAGEEKQIALVSRKMLYTPVIALLALVAAFLYPGWSTLAYLLVPLVIFVPERIYK